MSDDELLGRCLALLEDIEFVDTSDGEYDMKCPWCLSKRQHTPKCPLFELINQRKPDRTQGEGGRE